MISRTSSVSRTHVLRLRPGDEVVAALEDFVRLEKLAAAVMVTAVGSMTRVALRYANAKETTVLPEGHYEVVSLVGTLGCTSGHHLHLSVSDGQGVTRGGHLMKGCIVFTTLELAISSLDDCRFVRVPCDKSGYDELQIVEA